MIILLVFDYQIRIRLSETSKVIINILSIYMKPILFRPTKEEEELILSLCIEKKTTKAGILHLGLSLLKKNDNDIRNTFVSMSDNQMNHPSLKTIQKSKEIIKNIPKRALTEKEFVELVIPKAEEKLKTFKMFSFCPIHTNSFLHTCKCLESGQLFSWLKTKYEEELIKELNELDKTKEEKEMKEKIESQKTIDRGTIETINEEQTKNEEKVLLLEDKDKIKDESI